MVKRSREVIAGVVMCGLTLSGCAHSKFVEHPITSWFTAGDPEPSVTVNPDDKHCSDLAKQRMRDAGFEGEDQATQREVYRRSYDECTAWNNRADHKSSTRY